MISRGRQKQAKPGASALSAKAAKSSVRSVEKALRLLETMASFDVDMTLSELAKAAKLDPGTTHRMLKTMLNAGYVARSDPKHFTLTLKVLDLGFRAIGRRDIRALARPTLRTLVDGVNEAASLGVLVGGSILYIERIRAGITRLGVDIRVGTLIPAASSVIGWAILAFLPSNERARVLNQPTHGRNIREVAAPPDLNRILTTVRRQGFALSSAKIATALTVLAVPVLDRDGYPVAALSIAAPNIRMKSEALVDRGLAPLLRAAELIARGLEAGGSAVVD
jgi:IclR family pca regulon transcriptional regulator